MGNSDYIKESIEKRLGMSRFKQHMEWSIGITNHPDEIRKRQGNPESWYQWRADSLPVAKAVEAYYLKAYPGKEEQRMRQGRNTRDMDQRKDPFVFIYPNEEAFYS